MKINNFTPLIWVLLASSLNFCTAANVPDLPSEQEGTVVVIGDIGHGKSTVIASLLTEMEEEYEEDEEYQDIPSGFKPKSGNVTGLPLMQLSYGERTTTTYATYALKDSNITLVDTRGLRRVPLEEEDNINKIQRKAIIELNHIFKTRKIKGILVVVDFASLGTASGLGFRSLYELADFFLDEQAIAEHVSRSLAVVITYPRQNDERICYPNCGRFIQHVYSNSLHNKATSQQRALVRVLQNESNTGKKETLKDYIKSINKEKVLTFHPVNNESKEKLIEVIKNFKSIPSEAFKEDIKATTAEWFRLYLKDRTANCAMLTFNMRNMIVGSLLFGCFVIACHYGKKTYYPDLNLWGAISSLISQPNQ